MKKLLSLIVSVVLLCSVCLSSALAVAPQYANTQAVINLLDAKNVKYTLIGVEDGEEQLKISNKGDNFAYTINLFFTEDNETIVLRIWNLVDFSESDLSAALSAVNTLNYSYRFVTFFVDESDYSVTLSMDMIVREGNSVADICWEGLMHAVSILDYDDVNAALSPLAK